MPEKINEFLFRNLKKQMQELLDRLEEENEYLNNEYEEKKYNFTNSKPLWDKYFNLQNQLLSYDLSDIPAVEWYMLDIISPNGDVIDFSKTKANIDFKTANFQAICNFKGCKIKNLSYYKNGFNPDYFDNETIKNYPDIFLSDIFSDDFKKKYYAKSIIMEDIINLNSNQIDELSQKNLYEHFEKVPDYKNNYLKYLNLNKAIELYKYSKDDYETIVELIEFNTHHLIKDKYRYSFINDLEKSQIKDIKDICYEYARKNIIENRLIKVDDQAFPTHFVNDNNDLFITDTNIPSDLKERFSLRSLDFEDLITFPNYFRNIFSIAYYVMDGRISTIINILGANNFHKLFYEHFDFFEHLYNEKNIGKFIDHLCDVSSQDTLTEPYNKIEEIFYNAVKHYYHYLLDKNYESYVNNLPNYLSSFNFNVIKKYHSWEEMKNYNKNTLLIDNKQYMLLFSYGFENIKRFEEESGLFSHLLEDSEENYINIFFKYSIKNQRITFKNGKLLYNDFVIMFSKILDYMRENSYFTDKYHYDFIKGTFRDNYPHLFLSEDAPEDLKSAFYTNNITINLLQEHQEYIPYILDKVLSFIINGNFDVRVKYEGLKSDNFNFLSFYSDTFGKEELLNLLISFGNVADDLRGLVFTNKPYEYSKEEIDNLIRETIYLRIEQSNIDYSNITDSFFRQVFSDIFINLDNITSISETNKKRIIDSFYTRRFSPMYIKAFPELIDILKYKDLKIPFRRYLLSNSHAISMPLNEVYFKNLMHYVNKEHFLKLCSIFGDYVKYVTPQNLKSYLIENEGTSKLPEEFDNLVKIFEKIIAKKCLNGEIYYGEYDAPDFLINGYPELFLSNEVPEQLRNLFYVGLNFEKLSKNFKKHLSYLENKAIKPSFIKGNKIHTESIISYFDLFGDKALKLGIQKPDTVDKMISRDKVKEMYNWYKKSGNKFIPDYIIMQNIPFEEADKFFTSLPYWSKLMKIKNFADNEESREAMLKLAYSFGVFNQDKTGFQKLYELLSGIPHTLSSEKYNELIGFQDFPITTNSDAFHKLFHEYTNLQYSLIAEGLNIDTHKDLIPQLYKKSEDNYVLTFNPQQYPKSMFILRNAMELISDSIVMTPTKAHQLFGGFTLEYNREFREFLLDNLDNINEENSIYIANIQKQFKEIKAMNSNRVLTFDLAISYVQQKKYLNIDYGNTQMVEIASIAGYTQEDFDTLQKIYNYGKIRVFSSIPRIENKTEKYTYEILRLDDPLALAIGTLTDCCQEIGNAAEVCMEHSMVDANGRIFVIKDIDGNIVSQSWVWRNKNVLCFDNIEIPNKAFKRAELNKEDFAKEVYDIYKQASKELMEEDEKVYKQLLDDGKITKEQYDGLRLGKVTVGLGYNDIANAIENNAIEDTDEISKPLDFEPPVDLDNELYINDSRIQYILEQRVNRISYNGPTLTVHNDIYKIYDSSNFTEKELYLLNELEVETSNNYYYNTQIDLDSDDSILSQIADNYNLNPETIKIILHPNFAIIYDENDNEIRIGDLFYIKSINIDNSTINVRQKIMLQIKLALEQIGKNKKTNINELDEELQEEINELIKDSNAIDIAKGFR